MLDGMYDGHALNARWGNGPIGSAGSSPWGSIGMRGGPAPDPDRQHTLKAPIHCSGLGLHTGDRITLSLCPADPDTGIVFRRTDLTNGARDIPARFDRVVDTRLCTTLVNDHGTRVATVEHLMAALAGCGVDNAVVEIDGREVPIMDGSAAPFVFLIECAGVAAQDAPRRTLVVERPVSVEDAPAAARLEPGPGFTLALGIAFESRAIGRQDLFVEIGGDSFKTELCRARTFGFLQEVEALRAAGLARGGSLENAVVVDGDRIVNEEGLRCEDEFVRHKALDCVGDLALAGYPITGHFRGHRTGHGLNNRMLHAFFADSENWTLMPVEEVRGTRALHAAE